MDAEVLAQLLDGATDTERQQIWNDLVAQEGSTVASQLWLGYFAATDAPITG